MRDGRPLGDSAANRLADRPAAGAAFAQQPLEHLLPDRFERRVVVDGLAVARPGERDGNRRTQRRRGTGGQRNDPVGQQNAFVDVVGDEDDGLSRRAGWAFPDADDLVLKRRPCQRIERAQRFIQEQHTRVDRQRPGDRYPLPHPAGQLVRTFVAGVRQVHHRHMAVGVFLLLLLGPLRKDLIDGQVDVLVDGQPGEERVVLKDHRAVRARSFNLGAVEQHRARVGFYKAGDERHQRRLARTGVSDDRHELPLLDREVDVVQNVRPTVALAQILQFKKRHVPPPSCSQSADGDRGLRIGWR